MTKMTKIEALNVAIKAIGEDNAEAVAKLNGMVEQLQKRAQGERKPTKTQIANVAVKEQIATILADGERRLASDVAKALEVSTSKASALLTQMKKDGVVNRTEEKGKAYFTLA